jgi:hypothetical protein
MQDQHWNEVAERGSRAITNVPELSESDFLKFRAQTVIKRQVAEEIHRMQAEGKAFTLTDEEERMLLSFRRFKATIRKDGEVFKWQTRREEGVIEAPERVHIADPQEVS